MRVCLIFGGFIRNYVGSTDLASYFRAQLPTASIIDMYMFAPDTIDSDTATPVDKKAFENSLKDANLGSVYIKWHTYTPGLFYEKARELGFKHSDINAHRYPPSRKLSMIYNYSKSVALAAEQGKTYDLAVLTRFDYIHKIQYNIPESLETGIYIFRKYNLNEVLPCAEDRLIYGSPQLIFQLKDFYDSIHTIFKRSDMCCEELFSTFYWYRVDHMLLHRHIDTLIQNCIISEDVLEKARLLESIHHHG